jgi:hypothetical protein
MPARWVACGTAGSSVACAYFGCLVVEFCRGTITPVCPANSSLSARLRRVKERHRRPGEPELDQLSSQFSPLGDQIGLMVSRTMTTPSTLSPAAAAHMGCRRYAR